MRPTPLKRPRFWVGSVALEDRWRDGYQALAYKGTATPGGDDRVALAGRFG